MNTSPSSTPGSFDPNQRLELTDAPPAIEPYPHQLAAWDRMTRHYLDDGKQAGLVVLPTGGGKTLVAGHWLLRNHIAEGGRVLWLAHRQSLLKQAFTTFKRLGNLAHPDCSTLDLVALSSEYERWSAVSPEHNVVFASAQSSVLEQNRGFLSKWRSDSKREPFVVIDEAHHAVAPRTLELLDALKDGGARLMGLTATPIRMDAADERRLGTLFDGTIIHQISRAELCNAGILAVPRTETVRTEINVESDMDPTELEYLDRYGDLGPSVLKRLGKNAHRNELIVEHYLRNRERYGSTIVFAADTLHAQTLAMEFKKRGVEKTDYVDYGRKDASAVIERYVDKQLDVIVNVQMLTEGFDAPHTRTVFIARPTRSESLVVQMVGRALRGKRAGGNDEANLVTFLDTWSQYDVIGAEYALEGGVVEPVETPERTAQTLVRIPPELIRDAYRLLQSNVKGQLVGVHACTPDGWYRWEEEFEDDAQTRTVIVFDSQREALQALLADYADPSSIPATIDEETAAALIRRYFADVPDPLPRWSDVKALLDARRKGCELTYVTFEEKRAFDPCDLAKKIVDADMGPKRETELLTQVWNDNPACTLVYRGDQTAFREEVSRERTKLLSADVEKPKTDPVVVAIVPQAPPRPWASDETPRSLPELLESVLLVKGHFPRGAPTLKEVRWMTSRSKRTWGFFRYQDKSLALNPVLDSPDVPRYVVEFLLYHELLHADMPSAGHNADFRARERRFQPSEQAQREAAALGIEPGPDPSVDYWRVRADNFLDTFERYFKW